MAEAPQSVGSEVGILVVSPPVTVVVPPWLGGTRGWGGLVGTSPPVVRRVEGEGVSSPLVTLGSPPLWLDGVEGFVVVDPSVAISVEGEGVASPPDTLRSPPSWMDGLGGCVVAAPPGAVSDEGSFLVSPPDILEPPPL